MSWKGELELRQKTNRLWIGISNCSSTQIYVNPGVNPEFHKRLSAVCRLAADHRGTHIPAVLVSSLQSASSQTLNDVFSNCLLFVHACFSVESPCCRARTMEQLLHLVHDRRPNMHASLHPLLRSRGKLCPMRERGRKGNLWPPPDLTLATQRPNGAGFWLSL